MSHSLHPGDTVHRAWNRGSRLPRKASTPSAKSSVQAVKPLAMASSVADGAPAAAASTMLSAG
jgi:hypothetical protein